MISKGREILEELLAFLYPPRCPVCGAYLEERGQWCPACLSEVAQVQRLPLPPKAAKVLVGVWALGHYRSGLRDLIRGLKYSGKKGNLASLRIFLDSCEDVTSLFPRGIVATPVPLHPSREKKRGFNQAELIFKDWLAERRIPMETLLKRQRETKAQYGLTAKERQDNMRDAFSPAEGASLRGRNILLVDDIMTTGATLLECAAALKRGGAARIYGLVLASDRGLQ